MPSGHAAIRITTPDLIALVDTQTGEGIYNWSDDSLVREGLEEGGGRKIWDLPCPEPRAPSPEPRASNPQSL